MRWGRPLPGAPLADPGVRFSRTGLLRETRTWNQRRPHRGRTGSLLQAGSLTPVSEAIVSRGRCFARVASLPTPSPCNRPDRLGLLLVGLTPSRAHPHLHLVECGRPAQRAGLAARSPEFEVPPFCLAAPEVHHIRFSVTVPRSYSTPMEPMRARHDARTGAAFPLTLQGRLPYLAITGLYQSSGECESTCGLATSLCTLRRCCSASLHATPVGATSGNDLGNAAISRDF